MKNRLTKAAFFFIMAFVVVSCVTINIYFPAAAVEKAAEDIVEEVWGAGEDAVLDPVEGESNNETGPQGLSLGELKYLAISLFVGTAHAAEGAADINVSTPRIRALKGSIHNRSDALKPFLNKGNVGIGNDGLLSVRSTKGLNLKYKSILNKLLQAENNDREALYREIAAANEITPDKINDIKSLFAKSWIKNARKGWLIQGEDGAWSKK
ncbi:MAG: YdbL family protein [Proteobacteria bacterium]|nr:YdbL family protein [Pseudomonadota bacterium]